MVQLECTSCVCFLSVLLVLPWKVSLTKVIIAIIMANKIEGSEIFDVPAQPKGWQAAAFT